MAKFNRKGHRNLTLAEQYERYLSQFNERLAKLREKEIETPIDRYGFENPALNFEEFIQAFQDKKRTGVSTTNIIREIVSEQLYFQTQAEASALQQDLIAWGIVREDGTPYSVRELRTGTGRNLLSQINNMLKETGVSSGKARAKYIGYWIFDSE